MATCRVVVQLLRSGTGSSRIYKATKPGRRDPNITMKLLETMPDIPHIKMLGIIDQSTSDEPRITIVADAFRLNRQRIRELILVGFRNAGYRLQEVQKD